MPAFNRPPEWQRQADRRTELVDPVLTVRQLRRFDLSLKSLVRIDRALVFVTPKGNYDTFLPPRQPTRAEIAGKRYTTVYEVDMGRHLFSAELALPSDNDAFEFTAAVDLSWMVTDPARFVSSGHRHVPALVLGELQQVARSVTRCFAIRDSAAAERELLQTVSALGPLGAVAGLQVTVTLRLRRDHEDVDHRHRLQVMDHSDLEQIRVAERGTEIGATEITPQQGPPDRESLEAPDGVPAETPSVGQAANAYVVALQDFLLTLSDPGEGIGEPNQELTAVPDDSRPRLFGQPFGKEELDAVAPVAEETIEHTLARMFVRLGPPSEPTELNYTPAGSGGGGAQQ